MHSSLSIWTPSEIWDWPAAKVHCDHWLLVCSNFYWTTCCHCVTKDSGLLRGFQGSNMHLTIPFGFVCCPQQKRTITKTLVVHGCSGSRLCLWLVFYFWGRYVKRTSWFVMRLTHNKHQQLWFSFHAIGPPMDFEALFCASRALWVLHWHRTNGYFCWHKVGTTFFRNPLHVGEVPKSVMLSCFVACFARHDQYWRCLARHNLLQNPQKDVKFGWWGDNFTSQPGIQR